MLQPPPPPYSPPPARAFCVHHLDAACLVVDKPAGLLSVPGRGAAHADCLVARLQAWLPDCLIVHRLDMDTSGLIVLARTPESHRRLSIAFAARSTAKRYVAVVGGLVQDDEGDITWPLICDWPNRPRQMVAPHGKASLTRWQVLDRDLRNGVTRVALLPVTGRSHQLRVHMAALGHPILGDPLYAPPRLAAASPRLLLHASALQFAHPEDGRTLSFRSPPPF